MSHTLWVTLYVWHGGGRVGYKNTLPTKISASASQRKLKFFSPLWLYFYIICNASLGFKASRQCYWSTDGIQKSLNSLKKEGKTDVKIKIFWILCINKATTYLCHMIDKKIHIYYFQASSRQTWSWARNFIFEKCLMPW